MTRSDLSTLAQSGSYLRKDGIVRFDHACARIWGSDENRNTDNGIYQNDLREVEA